MTRDEFILEMAIRHPGKIVTDHHYPELPEQAPPHAAEDPHGKTFTSFVITGRVDRRDLINTWPTIETDAWNNWWNSFNAAVSGAREVIVRKPPTISLVEGLQEILLYPKSKVSYKDYITFQINGRFTFHTQAEIDGRGPP